MSQKGKAVLQKGKAMPQKGKARRGQAVAVSRFAVC
jgi:hypothetical protein